MSGERHYYSDLFRLAPEVNDLHGEQNPPSQEGFDLFIPDYQQTEAKPRTADSAESLDAADLYFEQMNHPLLSREQEQYLFRMGQIGQRQMVSIDEVVQHPDYARFLDGFSPEERKQASHIASESTNLQHFSSRFYLRLSASMARKYIGSGVPYLDLVQEGNIGILKAVERFDPDTPSSKNNPEGEKVKFSTYAVWWVRQSISRSIAEKGRTIRLPYNTGTLLKRGRQIASELEQEEGRMIQRGELKKQLITEGFSDGKAEFVAKEILEGGTTTVSSLDRPLTAEGDVTLGVLLPSPDGEQVDTTVQKALESASLDALLSLLPERERFVLLQRFGFIDGEIRTLAEVGEMLGVSRERVRQIELQTLKKLRTPEFKDFLLRLSENASKENGDNNHEEHTIFENGATRSPDHR